MLALRADAIPDVPSLKEVPLVAVTPQDAEVPVAEVVQPQPETVAMAQPQNLLPKTGSSLPMFVTIALLCLLIGVTMQAFSKRPTGSSINQIRK